MQTPWTMTKAELASECLKVAQQIENAPRRTARGDEIAKLLSAAGWELYGWNRATEAPTAVQTRTPDAAWRPTNS